MDEEVNEPLVDGWAKEASNPLELPESSNPPDADSDEQFTRRDTRHFYARENQDDDPNAELIPSSTHASMAALGAVGKFQLIRMVGRGGMGKVFLAYDPQLDRHIALKLPRVDSVGDPQLLSQFLKEARLAAQLNHPNLVKIYEVGVSGDSCFIASEWCEGGDLAQWLRQNPGRRNPKWAAELVRAIARAVAYCHQQNIVHLDIKPANIILTICDEAPAPPQCISDSGLTIRPTLTDFGVAKVVEEGLTMTHTSMLMGTPSYMAPEQAECARELIGPKSDIYALGVVLYEMLFGRRPFNGDTAVIIMDQIRQSHGLIIPACSGVPEELRTIVERCLQHCPVDRYPSADALAEDLDRYLRGEPIHAKPVSKLQRFWRWLERPERLFQAGVTSLAIQSLFLIDFVIVLASKAAGFSNKIPGDSNTLFLQVISLAVIFHIPCIGLAIAMVFKRRGALLPSILISSITLLALLHGLITGRSTISAYDGQPLALLLVYIIFSVAISIQLAACVAALPYVLSRGRGNMGQSTHRA